MRILLFICTSFIFIASCRTRVKPTFAKGPITSQAIKSLQFHKIISDLDADIHVRKSDSSVVKLYAAQNILDLITTEANANELILTLQEGVVLDTNAKIRIEVFSPKFDGCKLIGYGTLLIDSGFSATRTQLSLMGKGKIEMYGSRADHMSCMVSGDGDIILHNGMSKSGEYAIKGNGNIQAAEIVVDTLKAMISGTGNIHTTCNGDLDATITGDGNIYYKGNCTVSRAILNGRGEVVKE